LPAHWRREAAPWSLTVTVITRLLPRRLGPGATSRSPDWPIRATRRPGKDGNLPAHFQHDLS